MSEAAKKVVQATWRGWIVCGLAAFFYCYEYLLRVSPSVMIPDLMQALNASASTIGWLTALYYYAYTPIQLPVGIVMDKYGPRRVLTMAVALCAFGSLFFASNWSFAVMGLARFMVGLGSAFAFVGVLKLATLWLPADRFAFISGLTTALGMLGAIFGEVVLSQWVTHSGWQASLVWASAVGLVLLPIMWFVVRDAPEGQEIEPAIHEGFGALWHDVGQVFGNRQVWLTGLIGALMFLPTIVFAELWGIECLKVLHQMTVHQATHVTSLIFLGWAVGAPLMGLFSDRMHRRRLPILFGASVATMLMVGMLYVPGISHMQLKIMAFTFGVFSAAQILVFAIAKENVPVGLAGTAMATTNFMIMCGGMVFQPLVGKILDWTWQGDTLNGLPVYTAEGFQWALAVLPAGLFCTLIVLLFVKETHARGVS